MQLLREWQCQCRMSLVFSVWIITDGSTLRHSGSDTSSGSGIHNVTLCLSRISTHHHYQHNMKIISSIDYHHTWAINGFGLSTNSHWIRLSISSPHIVQPYLATRHYQYIILISWHYHVITRDIVPSLTSIQCKVVRFSDSLVNTETTNKYHVWLSIELVAFVIFM